MLNKHAYELFTHALGHWRNFNNDRFLLVDLLALLITREVNVNPEHIASVVVALARGRFREYIDHLDRVVSFRLSQDLLHEAWIQPCRCL